MKKLITPKSVRANKIRINIDLDWSSGDFAVFFGAFDSLYTFYESYEEGLSLLKQKRKSKTVYAKEEHTALYHFRTNAWLIKSFFNEEGIYRPNTLYQTGFIDGKSPSLKVVAVKYSSPGFTDFAGLSGIIGHLKEIMMYYFPSKLAKEEIKIKEQERVTRQIKNLRQMGFSSIEIKKIILLEEINRDKLKSLIESGNITSIEISED